MQKTCETCNSNYKTESRKQRFCSLSCRDQYWREHGHFNQRGGTTRKDGYRMICVDGKPILEHRHVMSLHLGRPLLREEVVHHIDRNPLNNDISNLELDPCNAAHMHKHFKWFRSETHKQCWVCKETMPRDMFYKAPPSKRPTPFADASSAACKACTLQINRQYKEKRAKRPIK